MTVSSLAQKYGIAILILITAIIQSISYLNSDSAWLLVAADRMVAGEHLYIDIAETNPPLIVWLHSIAVYAASALSCPLDHAFIICVLVATTLSLFACKRVNPTYPHITILFACMVTLFATQNFGQREHVFLLFAMPYFLSLLPGNKPSLIAGLCASIGFALKPYFVLFFIAAMLYHASRNKTNLLHKIHMAAAIPVILYVAYLLCINTTYLTTTAIPLMGYYQGYTVSTLTLLKDILPIALLMLGSYGLWRMAKQNSPTIDGLFLLSIAALGTILWQQKGWMNHWYLFYCLAFCLNASIIWQMKQTLTSLWSKLAMTLAIMASLAIAGIYSTITYNMLRHQQFDHVAPTVERLSSYADSSLMSFSFDLMATFPAALHANLRYEGTYAHLWFLPGLYQTHVQQDEESGHHIADYRPPSQMSEQERQWFDSVASEFTRLLPDIVIVTQRNNYYHPEHSTYGFNFIDYYSQSPYFAQSWRQYDLIDTIGNEQIYTRRTHRMTE